MKEKEFTCIMCPVGCHLKVYRENGEVKVVGNACPRGEVFGKSEFSCPTRMVTSIMPTKSGTISVKTSNPIPKDKIKDCLMEIKMAKAPLNPKLGQVVINNVCSTGENVIITGVNKN